MTSENQEKIVALLSPLSDGKFCRMEPAGKEQIQLFKERANEKQVPQEAVDQLIDLYLVADNFCYDMILGFHSCTDDIIFEWWAKQEIWLGQRDMNTLRWKDGKWCLGTASTTSYSKEYECDTLIELIKRCVRDIAEFNNKNNG